MDWRQPGGFSSVKPPRDCDAPHHQPKKARIAFAARTCGQRAGPAGPVTARERSGLAPGWQTGPNRRQATGPGTAHHVNHTECAHQRRVRSASSAPWRHSPACLAAWVASASHASAALTMRARMVSMAAGWPRTLTCKRGGLTGRGAAILRFTRARGCRVRGDLRPGHGLARHGRDR